MEKGNKKIQNRLNELINLVRLENLIKKTIENCKDERRIKAANILLKEISRKIANIELFEERKTNDSVLERAKEVKNEVDKYYEPHSHRHCKKNIYDKYIKPKFKIGIATYNRYLKIAIEKDGFIGNGGNRIYKNNGKK